MTDSQLGLTVVFNGCIYNYQAAARAAGGHGHRFFSTSDTEVAPRVRGMGDSVRRALHGDVRFCDRRAQHGSAGAGPGPPRDQAPLPGPDRERLRFASTLPALLAAGGTDTSLDKVALAHYMTFHSVVPAAANHLDRRPQAPAGHRTHVEPDGRVRLPLLDSRLQPGSGRRPAVGAGLAGDAARQSPGSGGAADGRRRPSRRAAVRWDRLQPCGGAAGRGRAARPGHIQHRLRVRRRRVGRRVRVLRAWSPGTSTPTTIGSRSTARGCSPASTRPLRR